MIPLTDSEAALLDGCCLVFETGSRLYGCAEPGSDRDLRGIAAPTRADYLELRRPRERTVAQGADVQTWGLHHWCGMFAKGSPNAMEVALLPPSAVVRADPLGRAAMDAAHDAMHAGFIPHLAHYAHNQHHMYERGDQPGKRLMHAVRVMRLAVSLASTGAAELADPDAASLLAIRHGALMAGEAEYRRLEERLAARRLGRARQEAGAGHGPPEHIGGTMEYTRHGNNAALSIHVLDDTAMRALGFTDCVPEDWYLCRPVSDDRTTSLDVTAAKDGSDWRIDVLDEDFGQPYDYQWLLSQNPDLAYARRVAANVERELRVLADAGVLIGWEEGMYV